MRNDPPAADPQARRAGPEASVARLALAVRSAGLGLFDTDLDRGELRLSAEAAALFGFDAGVVTTLQDWQARVHPDDRARVAQAVDDLQRAPAGELRTVDYRFRRPDGSERWLRSTAIWESGAAGRAGRRLGTVQDVTEAKRLEAEQRESSDRFRLLVESLEDVFWIVDVDAGLAAADPRQVYVSPSYERIWKLDRARLMDGEPRWADAIHPDDRAAVRQSFEQAVHGGSQQGFTIEYRLRFGDGRWRWIRDRGIPVADDRGRVRRVIGIAEDITDRRTVIRALIEREERLKLAIAAANLHVWSFDLRSRLLGLADELCALLGLTAAQCRRLGHGWRRVHPEDRSRVHAEVRRFLASGPLLETEFRIRHAQDGRITWLSLRAIVLPDEDGRPAVVHGVCTDVTGRVTDRERLRERGERLSLALSAARMSTWTLDLVTGEMVCGGGLRETLGLPADQPVTHEAWSAVIHPDDRAEVRQAFVDAVGQHQRFDRDYRIRRGGRECWINSQAAIVYGPDGRARTAFGVISDITARKLDEQRLLESEAQLQRVADAAPIGIVRCDADGRYRFANREYVEHFAQGALGGLLDRRLADIVGEDGYRRLMPHLERVRAGERVRFETVLRYPRIGDRHVRIDLVPDRAADGRLDGWFAAVEDITQRKESEQQLFRREREFKTLVENAPDIIGRLDRSLRYLYINRAAESTFGIRSRPQRQTGRELGLPETVATTIESVVERVFATHAEQAARIETGDDDPVRHFDLRAMPETDREGGVESVLIVVYDVTERVRGQAERDRLLALEHDARRRAEAAAQARDQFLAIVSHELRSPLNGIQSWTHVLEGAIGDGKPIVGRAVAGIRIGVAQQVRLIDDLLDATRIMSGKLSLTRQPIRVMPAIDAALESLEAAAADKRITITRHFDDRDAVVDGDADRLQQVVWNLVSNAIKFTPAEGHVWLTVQTTGEQVAIVVKDDGKGIAADFMPHLFEWFRRDDTGNSRGQDGLGLGLALVHHLVQMFEGTISVASAGPGLGSTFTVRLPVTRERRLPSRAERERTPPEAGPSTLDGLQLLLVDDQRETREALGMLLGQLGAEVVPLASGIEALRWIEQHQEDTASRLLICDIAMPVQDGYETLALLRRWERSGGHPRLPAIALTAFAQRDDRIRALRAGFDMHLSKPAALDELAAMIVSLSR